MKKLSGNRRAFAGKHRCTGPVHLRIWRPDHSRRSRSRNRSDSRRLRQYRQKAKRSRNDDGDRDRPRKHRHRRRKTSPRAAPDAPGSACCAVRTGRRTAAPAPFPQPPHPSQRPARARDFDRCRNAPADTVTCPPPPPPVVRRRSSAGTGSRRRAPEPSRVAARRRLRRPSLRRAPQAANSPLGIWLTEEKEGKVRIEQCGANLCGYSVDKKTNQNGEQVLINMKPGKANGAAGFSIRTAAAPMISPSR